MRVRSETVSLAVSKLMLYPSCDENERNVVAAISRNANTDFKKIQRPDDIMSITTDSMNDTFAQSLDIIFR